MHIRKASLLASLAAGSQPAMAVTDAVKDYIVIIIIIIIIIVIIV